MLIAVSHLDDVVRGWFLQFVFDLFQSWRQKHRSFPGWLFRGSDPVLLCIADK